MLEWNSSYRILFSDARISSSAIILAYTKNSAIGIFANISKWSITMISIKWNNWPTNVNSHSELIGSIQLWFRTWPVFVWLFPQLTRDWDCIQCWIQCVYSCPSTEMFVWLQHEESTKRKSRNKIDPLEILHLLGRWRRPRDTSRRSFYSVDFSTKFEMEIRFSFRWFDLVSPARSFAWWVSLAGTIVPSRDIADLLTFPYFGGIVKSFENTDTFAA